MKIAVYTIAKNEEQYARRWAKNTADADYRVVLDTGSSDATVQILKDAGVTVYESNINPWRFDEARNLALSHVPADADVCISLDMDEVLRDGWRQELEAAWTPQTTLLRHPLYPKWTDDHKEPEQYYGYVGRVHARDAYQWHYALHEVLRPLHAHVETFSDSFIIDHHTDNKKEKKLYTEMLKTLVANEPAEPRYAYYFGVELFNRGNYQESIAQFERYLQIESTERGSERGFVKRLMARAYRALGFGAAQTLPLLHSATADAPNEREAWVELAASCAEVGNWPNCLSAAANALRCTNPRDSFQIDFASWQGKPEQLLEQSAEALQIPNEVLINLKTQIGA